MSRHVTHAGLLELADQVTEPAATATAALRAVGQHANHHIDQRRVATATVLPTRHHPQH